MTDIGQLPFWALKMTKISAKNKKKTSSPPIPPCLPSTNDDPIFTKGEHRMGFCLRTAATCSNYSLILENPAVCCSTRLNLKLRNCTHFNWLHFTSQRPLHSQALISSLKRVRFSPSSGSFEAWTGGSFSTTPSAGARWPSASSEASFSICSTFRSCCGFPEIHTCHMGAITRKHPKRWQNRG